MNATIKRVLAIVLAIAPSAVADDDLVQLEQQAFIAAADAVADSVVQIRTIGGLDQVDGQSLAQGPTTGLIVSADGYIVSSAINFVQEPASILVRLPGGRQVPAEMVGRDTSLMLVLLKVDAPETLPVAEAAAVDEIEPGDWAIALGRTYDAERVDLSVGVVSALNRMHGRAIQTDANVSASNYGGALVDIQGRVMGVLAPMAPQTGGNESSAMAGSEFYDSGIGFAVPLSRVLAVLDRWKEEKDLKRGLLGVSLKAGNPHSTPPIVTAVWPRSPAAAAGWKPKDQITAVDGNNTTTQTELRFATYAHYAGDTLRVNIRRRTSEGVEEIETRVKLVDKLPAYRHAFLGVLPVRPKKGDDANDDTDDDDDEASMRPAQTVRPDGVAIRGVWPGGPADRAGIKAGDVILRLGDEAVASNASALTQMNAKSAGDEIKVQVKRGDDLDAFNVELAELPTEILSTSDLPIADADENKAGAHANVEEVKIPGMSQAAQLYRPSSELSLPGLLIWLGRGGEGGDAAIEAWRKSSERYGIALLVARPGEADWSSDDIGYLDALIKAVDSRLAVDPQRVVVAGQGKAGQLAYALAFRARKTIHGVVTIDSPLPRTFEIPDNSANDRLAVLTVESQDSPFSLLMRHDREQMQAAGFPTSHVIRQASDNDPAALDATTCGKACRWIEGLDRL